jgi:hypothetical protein
VKVLFICKKRINNYGVSTGLLNSATFVANILSRKKGFETKVVSVIDNNYIDAEVYKFQPDFVIIEAYWVVPSKFDVLCSLYPNVQWVVRSHSKIPFFANEGIAMSWTSGYKEMAKKYDNFCLSFNEKDTNNDISRIFNFNTYYLPNIYYPIGVYDKNRKDKNPNHIHIGCFGAIRPLKNHLIQAVSAIIYADNIGKKLFFHINGNRLEQKGENSLKNLRNLFEEVDHELVEHPWLSHDEFMNAVKSMDMGMQVSLTESFNIVTADFVYNGKPVIVSPDINWLSFLCHANPNDSRSIVKGLFRVKLLDFFGFKYINSYFLKSYNKKALKKWLSFFDKIKL